MLNLSVREKNTVNSRILSLVLSCNGKSQDCPPECTVIQQNR